MKNKVITVIGLSGQSLFFELDKLPQTGETVLAGKVHEEQGGKGFNQAIALAKLGASVNFITFVGDDDYGKKIFTKLKSYKVNPTVIKVFNQRTAVASILTDRTGQNTVIVHPGVSENINGDMLLPYEEIIAQSDILLMQLEYPLSIIEKGLAIAKKHNVKAIINPAPFLKTAYEYLEQAFLLTPNEVEAKMLFSLSPDASREELKENIRQSNFRQMVITLGKDGVLFYHNNDFLHFPALPLRDEEVMDTTGAGDAFNASLAYQLAQNTDFKKAISFATVASGLSVTKKYCLNAFPQKNEVEKILKEYEKEVAKKWN